MKSKILILAIFITVSCKQDDTVELSIEDRNLQKVTIQAGLTGTLKVRKGNCMPMMDDSGYSTSCHETPIRDTLAIHELTSWNDLVGDAVFYDSIQTERIATIISDNDGFYELALKEGQYSVFIVCDNKYFASVGTSDGVNPVTVKQGSLTIFHPVLDLAVY